MDQFYYNRKFRLFSSSLRYFSNVNLEELRVNTIKVLRGIVNLIRQIKQPSWSFQDNTTGSNPLNLTWFEVLQLILDIHKYQITNLECSHVFPYKLTIKPFLSFCSSNTILLESFSIKFNYLFDL